MNDYLDMMQKQKEQEIGTKFAIAFYSTLVLAFYGICELSILAFSVAKNLIT